MLRNTITTYTPGKSFPPISITASFCSLDCAHCGGRYLKHMLPATTPEALVALCHNLWEEGRRGVLISGGCDMGGSVPLGPFLSAIGEIKKTTDLVVNVHTGLLDEGLAEGLISAEVDVVSFDLVGSRATVREIYGLDLGPEDYARSLDLMKDSGLRVVPHICIGLDHGQIVGERHALSMVRDRELESLVFIVLVPTRGTRMKGDVPPTPEEVGRIIMEARDMMPDTRLLLGCMRPKGLSMELAALDAGIDGIVLPSRAARDWLSSKNVNMESVDACCVVL